MALLECVTVCFLIGYISLSSVNVQFVSQPSLKCPTPATVRQIPFITGMDRVAENPGQSPQNPYLLQNQGPRSHSHLVEAREIARKQGKLTWF